MNRTAYSYKRWSSSGQGKGHSDDRQTELAEEYCRRHDLVLDTKLRMSDKGLSGWSGKNVRDGALGAFIKAIDAGTVLPGSFLLVEDVDRLSRLPIMEALAVFQRIIGAGVTVVTLRDGQQYSSELIKGDWTKIFPVLFSMGRGHEESNLKSERIGKAWKRKKADAAGEDRKPHGKNCPMWLDYSVDTGYSLNPERRSLVKRMFQLYIDGYGMVAISRILNEDGERTARDRAWNVSSVEGVLYNRAVIGEYQPRNGTGRNREDAGPPIPNYYPPAIDEATFYLAQKARTSRRVSGASRQPKNFNVWQGIAKCYLCGNSLHMVDKGVHKYIHCYGAKKGMCKAGYVRLELAELVFREVLAKMNSSFSLVADSSADLSRQIGEIDGRISDHQEQIAQLAKALQGPYSQTIVNEVIRREGLVADLKKQREELSLALASEAIVDKEAFFKALDLVSYEGRNRANALLKELHVTVRFNPASSLFRVMQGDVPAFDITKTDGGFVFHAGRTGLRSVIREQEGGFRPYLIEDYNAVVSDYESEDASEGDGHLVTGEY